jgi:uncharacterized protein (DUF1501 family)
MRNRTTRREFMTNAAIFSAVGMAPQFLTHAVEAATRSIEGFQDDRILVVVQLSGGNDGLNTLVPFNDDAYYRGRPQLGLKGERLLKLNDELAFNAELAGLKSLYDDGHLAIVQGTGYPNPDRSHFRSMEIWHTASGSNEFIGSGWIGRYFDHNCSGTAGPHVGVSLGKERPQAFDGERGLGVSFENPRRYGWEPGRTTDTVENFTRLNASGVAGNNTLDFLRRVTSNAIMSSKEVSEAAERGGVDSGGRRAIGRGGPSHALNAVASLIKGNLATRIFYVSASGFDTHANQSGQHDSLLRQVSDSLASFQEQLKRDGTSDRVLTMVFSEFGRRVAENGSGGTDHGTAAPMFLVGELLHPGLHGKMPSLTELDQGDLIHTVDFRSVYANVLEGWFGVDARTVLGDTFTPLKVIL